MNNQEGFKQVPIGLAPKEVQTLLNEPEVVEALNSLTQLGVQESSYTSEPNKVLVKLTVNGKSQLVSGVLNRISGETFKHVMLDVSLSTGDRFAIARNNKVQYRVAAGNMATGFQLELYPVQGSIPKPLIYTVSAGTHRDIGNFFGSSYGAPRPTSDHEGTWTETQVSSAYSPDTLKLVDEVGTSLFDSFHFKGPEYLYGMPDEDSPYTWRVSLIGSAARLMRDSYEYIDGRLASHNIQLTLQLPEGAKNISAGFTAYGVPVFCYQSQGVTFVTLVHREAGTETFVLHEDSLATSTSQLQPNVMIYDPQTQAEAQKFTVGSLQVDGIGNNSVAINEILNGVVIRTESLGTVRDKAAIAFAKSDKNQWAIVGKEYQVQEDKILPYMVDFPTALGKLVANGLLTPSPMSNYSPKLQRMIDLLASYAKGNALSDYDTLFAASLDAQLGEVM